MAIARVLSGQNVYNQGGNSLTFDCTGVNLLIVSCAGQTSAPTYNSVALTALGYGRWYYMISPPQSSNTLAIPNSGTDWLINWIGYSGVNTTVLIDNHVQITGSSGTASGTITPNVANCWLIGEFMGGTFGGNGFVATCGGALTSLKTDKQVPNSNNPLGGIGDSNGTVAQSAQTCTIPFVGNSSVSPVLDVLSIAPQLTYTLSTAGGSFALTGNTITIALTHIYTLMATVGTYALTGSVTILAFLPRWVNQVLDPSTWSDGTKHSSSWTNGAKDSDSWTNSTKH